MLKVILIIFADGLGEGNERESEEELGEIPNWGQMVIIPNFS